MRDVINGVSAAEIRHLAEQYGLEVSDGEATALATSVTDRLDDSLDRIYEIPVRDEPTDPGERRWREPTDEYNALSVECHVPPAPEHTGLLDGVSAGLKDIISVAGVPMQCASGVMHGHVPSGDATVAHRLRAAGATIDAKTNLDEFAGGGQGKSFRGLIRNPTDEDRIAGGSSGGSAPPLSRRTSSTSPSGPIRAAPFANRRRFAAQSGSNRRTVLYRSRGHRKHVHD